MHMRSGAVLSTASSTAQSEIGLRRLQKRLTPWQTSN
jgi:hypothetical protein